MGVIGNIFAMISHENARDGRKTLLMRQQPLHNRGGCADLAQLKQCGSAGDLAGGMVETFLYLLLQITE